MNADKVAAAINATRIAEVIKINDGLTSIQIVHRVTKDHLSVWLGIVAQVLSRKRGWEDHICKRYFYQGGKIRYAWNFIAQWEDPEQKGEVLTQITKLFTHASQEIPQIYHQLESYPLSGVKEGRNAPQGPRDPRASGPMTGGVSQKGAHRL